MISLRSFLLTGRRPWRRTFQNVVKNDEKLRQLVQRIRTGLLIPMKGWGGKTPHDLTPSPHSGVEDGIDNGDPIENLESSNIEPIRNSQSQLRHRCLERDGNRCLATGHYSHGHAHPPNALTTHLQAAHILPFALGSREINDSEAVKVDGHSNLWFNLMRYFPILGSISFTSEQINLERNALTLDSQLYMEFSQSRLIFEATGVAHQYRIKTFPDTATAPIRDLPQSRLVKLKYTKEVGNFQILNSSKSTLVLEIFYI